MALVNGLENNPEPGDPIDHGRIISSFQNEEVGEYQNDQLGEFFTSVLPSSVGSTVAFGVPEGVIHIESQQGIASTVAFGTPDVDDLLTVGDGNGVASTVVVSTDLEIQQTITGTGALTSTASLSNDAQVSQRIFEVGAIAPTVAFGISEQQIAIEDPSSITSTVAFSTDASVRLLISPTSITSTAVFSTDGGFQGGIFRALIYKEGEISGIGSAESLFIAGGIRVNPSSRVTTSASAGSQTLPSNPVGFISVNIDGTDYKVPYYNT